ncbi:cation transporter [uncultured Croceitalea sp.]|uniref:cation transporter n=1 Tax=uncultured Croceitalea sp. TaxID=1798908 RepID=UPI003306869F
MSIARIPVQRSFCGRCSDRIKEALSAISDISNVNLYPMDALVVFNFVSANEISKVLNVLTELGYPEKGEKTTISMVHAIHCNGCFPPSHQNTNC